MPGTKSSGPYQPTFKMTGANRRGLAWKEVMKIVRQANRPHLVLPRKSVIVTLRQLWRKQDDEIVAAGGPMAQDYVDNHLVDAAKEARVDRAGNDFFTAPVVTVVQQDDDEMDESNDEDTGSGSSSEPADKKDEQSGESSLTETSDHDSADGASAISSSPPLPSSFTDNQNGKGKQPANAPRSEDTPARSSDTSESEDAFEPVIEKSPTPAPETPVVKPKKRKRGAFPTSYIPPVVHKRKRKAAEEPTAEPERKKMKRVLAAGPKDDKPDPPIVYGKDPISLKVLTSDNWGPPLNRKSHLIPIEPAQYFGPANAAHGWIVCVDLNARAINVLRMPRAEEVDWADQYQYCFVHRWRATVFAEAGMGNEVGGWESDQAVFKKIAEGAEWEEVVSQIRLGKR
jgi:hypothetical protein